MSFTAIALFCESVRDEVSGSATLVGVNSDLVQLENLPGVVPPMELYIRIHAGLDDDLEGAEFWLERFDGQIHAPVALDQEVVAEARAKAQERGRSSFGMVIRGNLKPIEIQEPGCLTVHFRTKAGTFVAGYIEFIPDEMSAII